MFNPRQPHRKIPALVEEQVRRWTLSREYQKQFTDTAPYWPVITVSREFGSLGAAMAEKVAERLGFTLWDNALVSAVAEETGAREALLATLDERAQSAVEEFIANVILGSAESEGAFVEHIAQVAGTIDGHGAAVIVGRGVQFILNRRRALRVRVICPIEDRIAGFAERQQKDVVEAERIVRATERERQTFIRRHYQQDVTEPSHYDVIINVGTLSLDAAADVVIAAYRGRFGRLPDGVRATT